MADQKDQDKLEIEEEASAPANAAEAVEALEDSDEHEPMDNEVDDAIDPAPADEDPHGAEEAPAEDDVIDIPGAEDAAPEPIAAAAPVEEVKRVGFFPVFLGGVIAACLGAFVMYYANATGWLSGGSGNSELQAKLDAQAGEIAALKETIAGLERQTAEAQAGLTALGDAEIDLGPVEETLAALGAVDADTATAVQELGKALADTRTRLSDLEVQPIPEAVLPQEVTAAYEKQLADVLASIETRFETMQAGQAETLGNLETDLRAQLTAIEAAQDEALATEAAAVEAAEKAAARAAMTRIGVALDSGVPFAEPLAALTEKTDVEIPVALQSMASEGAPSLNDLQTAFPDAARTALNETARDAAADGSISPLTTFILTQLGARSLEPREGNSPDAILSRAEAALGAGDLDNALVEIDALPPQGQTVFEDWISQATALRDAKRAAATLAAKLN